MRARRAPGFSKTHASNRNKPCRRSPQPCARSGYFFPTLRFDAPLLAPLGIPLLGDVLRRFSVSPWFALRPAQLKAVGAESLLTVPAAFALSRRYQERTAPMCIVAGAEDRYVSPRSHSVGLNRVLPRSRLLLVPGAGHMVHHTHGGEVVSALQALQMPSIA